MKILFCSGFSLFGTGSGTLIRTQTESFLDQGDEVAIISCENTTENVTKDDGVKYYPVFFTAQDENAEKIEGAFPFNFPMFTGSTVSTENFWKMDIDKIKAIMEKYQATVHQAIEEFQPDVIFGQHLWLHSYLAMREAAGKIPVVTTIHGTDLKGYGEKIPEFMQTASETDKKKFEIYKKCAEDAARMGDKFIVISEAQKKRFKELYPDYADKAVLVRNSYNANKFFRITDKSREEIIDEVFSKMKGHNDPETFDLADDPNAVELPRDFDKLAIFVGKFVEFKGVDSLINGWKEVEDDQIAQGKKPLCIIIGAGPLGKTLREEAAKVGTKTLYFVNRQGPDIINPLHNISDAAMVPSIHEPDGLVVKEALAEGDPVIGGNSGGIPETLSPQPEANYVLDEKLHVICTPLGMLIPNEVTREIKPDATDEELETTKIAAGKAIARATKAIFDGEVVYPRENLIEANNVYRPERIYQDICKVFADAGCEAAKKKLGLKVDKTPEEK
jgi:glycosyltransferase involved in cell wall biosynthesis